MSFAAVTTILIRFIYYSLVNYFLLGHLVRPNELASAELTLARAWQ